MQWGHERDRAADEPDDRRREALPPRRRRPWTCSGCSTSGCSTSRPRPSATRGATGSTVEGARADGVLRGAGDRGLHPRAWLAGWASYDSPLGYHPDRNLVPGVEISCGSLGHGLPLAVGTALGLRAQGIDARVVVLVGDAELDEGSNHEAVELAAALGLDALTVVVVDNRSSSYAVPGPDRSSGSRSRAGTPSPSTAATTTRSRRRCPTASVGRPERRRGDRRCEEERRHEPTLPRSAHPVRAAPPPTCVDEDLSVALVLRRDLRPVLRRRRARGTPTG